jgi:1,4-alpha-glucan branching enzyme
MAGASRRVETSCNPADYRLDRGDPREATQTLGAHPDVRDGVHGTRFAVWAPRASRVTVVGDWNNWTGDLLEVNRGSGIWHTFVPNVGFGARYKFAVVGPDGGPPVLKADPFARWAERRPANASRVWAPSGFEWGDGDWMANRFTRQSPDGPIAIYEVHLGSWQRSPETPHLPLGYRDLAHRIADHVRTMGYTHVELMPITEYPFDASWGYQVTSYFAPTARYGRPDDFRYLIDHLHQANIGVILDWVPAHFCKDAHGLGRFDGLPLFEYADPLRGVHPTWDTYLFDFGRAEVRNFLLASALYWLEEFHVDGLRVDAVAAMIWLDHGRAPEHWQPNERGTTEHDEAIDFLRRLNAVVHREVPDALTFAEEASSYQWVTRRGRSIGPARGNRNSRRNPRATVDAITPPPPIHGAPSFKGGRTPSLGFDVKWNMGWMNDTLRYFETEPEFRYGLDRNLTFPAWFAFDERFILPLSHDEVVHLKRALVTKFPGTDPDRFAGLRGLFAYQYAHPGKKLLFMGGEFGQWAEWQEDRSLDWHLLRFAGEGGSQTRFHRGVQILVQALNSLYRELPALHALDSRAEGFRWLRADTGSQGRIAFLRSAQLLDPPVAVVCNFSNAPVRYEFCVPAGGRWRELLNTDDIAYGGSGLTNVGLLATRRRAVDTDGYVGRHRGQGSSRVRHPIAPVLNVDLAPHAVSYVAPAGPRRQWRDAKPLPIIRVAHE